MSEEIKSIKQLNPMKNSRIQEDEVKEELSEAVEEVEVNDEHLEETTEETVENSHEDLEYINPNEDTTFGTAGFDFASSINRRRKTVTENIEALKQEIADEDLEKEVSEDEDEFEDSISSESGFEEEVDNFDEELDDEPEPTPKAVPKKEVKISTATAKPESIPTIISNSELPSQNDMFIDDSDFDDLDEDSMDDNNDISEQELNDLRTSITEKLKSSEENFGTTGLKVSKEAISITAALDYDESEEQVFDWPLMSAGKLVSMKSFSGTEIDSLNGGNSRNRFNNLKDIYRTFYNHIVEADKPEFEPWLKITSFMDIPHLYMAAYKSSFNGANYIPFTCTDDKCSHIFLSEDVPIAQNMVKFKDDAAKEKFNNIMNNSGLVSNKLYETRIVPVSKRFAIGFREPSIFNTIFENAVLDQKFIDKYQKLLSLMVYIDAIYVIKDGEYKPISLKVDRNNMAKTTKYRIATYAKVISKLSSDGYQKILSIIASINELGDEISYQLPEVTCPKCGHVIAAEEKESQELLFSRHQLALIANS